MENETQTEEAAVVETQTEETPVEPAYSYAEGIAGDGEKPEWFKDSKYKTVADQAKAYGELETRLGGFTGKPEAGYTFNEGVEAEDTPMLNSLREIGDKYNMSNDMFNEIVSTQLKIESEADEAHRTREIESLGENGQQRIDNINDYLKANVPTEFMELISGSVNNANDVTAIEAFISGLKNQPLAPAEAVASKEAEFTQSKYEEMLSAKDERGLLKTRDPEYLKTVRRYAADLSKLENRK